MKAFLLLAMLVVAASARSLRQDTTNCGDCQEYDATSGTCQVVTDGRSCHDGQGQCLPGGACSTTGAGDVTSESITPPSPAEDQSPPSPAGDQSPPSPAGDQSPPSPAGDQSPPSPAGDQSPPSPAGDQSPPSPAGDQSPPSPAEDQATPSPAGDQSPPSPAEVQAPPSPAQESPAPVPSPTLPPSPVVPSSPPATPPAAPDNVLCSNTGLPGGFSPVVPSKLPETFAELVLTDFLSGNYTYNNKTYKGCSNYTADVLLACQQVVSQAMNYEVLVQGSCIDDSNSWSNGVETVLIGANLSQPSTGKAKVTGSVLKAALLEPEASWNYEENTTCPGPITGAPGSWEPLNVPNGETFNPVQVLVLESTYTAARQNHCTSVVISDREACMQLVAGNNFYSGFKIKCVAGNMTTPSDTAKVDARVTVGLDGIPKLTSFNATFISPSA